MRKKGLNKKVAILSILSAVGICILAGVLCYKYWGRSVSKIGDNWEYNVEQYYDEVINEPPTEGFKYEAKDLYKGLDLSHHNKINDFDALSQFDFIYHKATEGATFVDPRFKTCYNECVKRGVPIGAYHFFTTTSSGEKQFENFKRVVPKTCALLPMLDIEINKNNWSKGKLNRELATWIKMCKEYYGVKPIIYSSSWFYKQYSLSKHKCLFWSGDINDTPRVKCCIHQKRFEKVKGIAGEVDYNESKKLYFNPNAVPKEI